MEYTSVLSLHVSDRTLRRRALQAAEQPPPPARPSKIRAANPSDVRFLAHLQRKYPNALGFLPTAALEWYAEHDCAKITEENGDSAGFILGAHRLKWQPLLRPIYQAAVAMDATRRHHGLALLEKIAAEATAAGQVGLQANCAAELEANEFWRAAGFQPIAVLTPANARKRDVICWRKPLVAKVPVWFAMLPERAGGGGAKPTSDRHRSILENFRTGKPHAVFDLLRRNAKP